MTCGLGKREKGWRNRQKKKEEKKKTNFNHKVISLSIQTNLESHSNQKLSDLRCPAQPNNQHVPKALTGTPFGIRRDRYKNKIDCAKKGG